MPSTDYFATGDDDDDASDYLQQEPPQPPPPPPPPQYQPQQQYQQQQQPPPQQQQYQQQQYYNYYQQPQQYSSGRYAPPQYYNTYPQQPAAYQQQPSIYPYQAAQHAPAQRNVPPPEAPTTAQAPAAAAQPSQRRPLRHVAAACGASATKLRRFVAARRQGLQQLPRWCAPAVAASAAVLATAHLLRRRRRRRRDAEQERHKAERKAVQARQLRTVEVIETKTRSLPSLVAMALAATGFMQATQVGRITSAWWAMVAVALQLFRRGGARAHGLDGRAHARLLTSHEQPLSKARTVQANLSALQPMLGRYVKVNEECDSLDEVTKLCRINFVIRKAMFLVNGATLSVDPQRQQFVFAVNSIIKWFKIVERYNLDGTETVNKRRDLRGGGAKSTLATTEEGYLYSYLRFSFLSEEDVATDTFVLDAGGQKLTVFCTVTVDSPPRTVQYKQVYRRVA